MSKASEILAKFFYDRSADSAFSRDEYTNSVWGGTREQLEELVVEGLIERPLGSNYVLTTSGRSLLGAHWGGR